MGSKRCCDYKWIEHLIDRVISEGDTARWAKCTAGWCAGVPKDLRNLV